MDIEIKIVDFSEISLAISLIEECFDRFIAPDYSPKGIETFKNKFIYNQNFLNKFMVGTEKMYGAYSDGALVGCLSISIHHTVSCVFVKGEFHRKGIATRLFDTIIAELKEQNESRIKLNASPYAIPFYRALGFESTGDEAEYEGIRFMPMQYDIK